MIVRLTHDAAPCVDDRDRADRLYATASGALRDMVFAPICRPADEDHVWVRVDALRTACEPEISPDAFSEMVAYAESKGWLDATKSFVRAHLEFE